MLPLITASGNSDTTITEDPVSEAVDPVDPPTPADSTTAADCVNDASTPQACLEAWVIEENARVESFQGCGSSRWTYYFNGQYQYYLTWGGCNYYPQYAPNYQARGVSFDATASEWDEIYISAHPTVDQLDD